MNDTQTFGVLSDGTKVTLFTILHPSGIRAVVTDLGASLVSLEVPDRKGNMGEVVLGLPRAEDYVAHAGFCFGATVGRFANRIAHGSFSLDGRAYHLDTNDAPGGVPCHLHGGSVGFYRRLWTLEDGGADFVRLLYRSADGEEGYPGALQARVTYRAEAGCALSWEAEAVTEAPTVVNIVHHPYWNLSGCPDLLINGHRLQLLARNYLPVGADKIPTGERLPVAGSPMDFLQPRMIGDVPTIDYDHCWVLDPAASESSLALAARLAEPNSGRLLEILTNQPGVQFYDGHCLDSSLLGRAGIHFQPRAGLCLEPQNFPDAPNQPGFPSSRLAPGQLYRNKVIYRFGLA